VNLIN
jgi:S-adenosylmethionine synthetase